MADLKYAGVSQLKSLSQFWYYLNPETTNIIYRFLGIWKPNESNPSELVAISGLAYWLTPPTTDSISQALLQAIVYIAYVLATCIITSHLSVHEADNLDSPDTLAEDLLAATHLTLAGKHEDSDEALRREVLRLVPVATILGALAMGSMCVVSDIFEIIGGGHSMLLALDKVYSMYEHWSGEQARLREVREANSLR